MHIAENTCKFKIKDIVIVAIEILALILLAQLVIHYMEPKNLFGNFFKDSNHESIETTLLYVLQSFLFLFPLYTYVAKKYHSKIADFGFRKVPIKYVIMLVAKAFGVVFLVGILLSYIQYHFNIQLPGFGVQESHIPLFGTSQFDIALGVLVVGVLAPFIEELLFRGFLLQTLMKYLPKWGASVIVAIIFGVIHFEFQSIGILIFLGFVLNWLYIKSNSTVPGIVFHVINNVLAFAFEFLK